jgi:hypothetical protein
MLLVCAFRDLICWMRQPSMGHHRNGTDRVQRERPTINYKSTSIRERDHCQNNATPKSINDHIILPEARQKYRINLYTNSTPTVFQRHSVNCFKWRSQNSVCQSLQCKLLTAICIFTPLSQFLLPKICVMLIFEFLSETNQCLASEIQYLFYWKVHRTFNYIYIFSWRQ